MDYLKIGMIMMNKKNHKSIMQKLRNKEPIHNTSIFIQCITLFLLGIVAIGYIFVPEFSGVVKVLLALTFITMAYNNQFLKRKGFTILYSLAGIVFLMDAIVEAYGS